MACCDVKVEIVEGNTVRITGTLVSDAAPTTGTGVQLTTRHPWSGEEETQVLTNPSTGVYQAEFLVDAPGQWWWRFSAVTPVTVSEGSFIVKKSQFN